MAACLRRGTMTPLRSVSAPPLEDNPNQSLMDRYVRSALCCTTPRPAAAAAMPAPLTPAAPRRGDPAAYSFVLGQVRTPGRPRVLAGWLRSLSLCAQDMSLEGSRELLSAVLRVDWTADAEVQDAFHALVLDLATSHSTWVPQMLRALFFHVGPKHVGGGGGGAYDVERSARALNGVVATVRELLRLVPLSSSAVWQTLVDMYPHRRHDAPTQEAWADLALAVCRCAPSIREPILSTVLGRVLQMDVEIRLEEDDAVAAAGGDDGELFFKPDDAEQRKDVVAKRTPQSTAEMAELAAKLDTMMERLFTYYDERMADGGQGAADEFEMLLRQFMHLVLPTYRSKSAQFLMFRACSHSSQFADSFLAALLRRAREESCATVMRVAACAYSASFMARAKFLSVDLVERYLRELLDIAQSHSATFQAASKLHTPCTLRQRQQTTVDPYQHQLFYAAVQAAMYVFCYEHERLLQATKALGNEPELWLHNLGFERVLASPLSPLRVCNQSVTEEFLSVWRSHTGTDCVPPELLGGTRLATTSSRAGRVILASQSGGTFTLEAFFPFDPYMLRSSSKFVDALYNSWTDEGDYSEADVFEEADGGAPAPAAEEDEEDEEEDDEDEDAERSARGVDIVRPTAQSAASSASDQCTPMSLGYYTPVYRAKPPAVPSTGGGGDVPMGSTPVSATNFNFSYD